MTEAHQIPNTRDLPWNELPPLPPAVDLATPTILRACITARAELAGVNALMETLPNKDMLIQALPLQEARSSSAVENIVTTSDALYQALASKSANIDPSAKEVLRYREALWVGVHQMRRQAGLTTALCERICSCIRGFEVRVRDDEVWLGDPASGHATYTPPDGRALAKLLANLEAFAADDDDGIDPIIKMAVMHYQFEAIHPFTDGNGRTGRVLNLLYLMQRGLLSAPVLYLSRFFIEHRGDYYDGLREVTERGHWQQWILYILRAVEHTSRDTAVRIKAIRRVAEHFSSTARGRSKAAARDGFIDILFKWPYCKIGIVERELGCARATATSYLNEMTAIGLLKRVKHGREYYYINIELMKLLAS